MVKEQEYLEVLNKLDEHDQDVIIEYMQTLKREIFSLKSKLNNLMKKYKKISHYE